MQRESLGIYTQEVALRIDALAHLQEKAPRGAACPGRRSKFFFVSSLHVRVLQSARFGYRQTEMKHNKFKTNKLTTAASQDQSQKPQQEYVFSNLPVSGIQGQTEMKHTKFKTNKLTTAVCTKHSRKRQDFKKRVSCGVVLMASTMLHEKCCNTVLQIGTPEIDSCGDYRIPQRQTPRLCSLNQQSTG